MMHVRRPACACLLSIVCCDAPLPEADVPSGIYQLRGEVVENTCTDDDAPLVQLEAVYRDKEMLIFGTPFFPYSPAAAHRLKMDEQGVFAETDYEFAEGQTRGSIMAVITAHDRAFQVTKREEHLSAAAWPFPLEGVTFPCEVEMVLDFELVEACESPCTIRTVGDGYVCDCSES